jgi:hypothetical protein
MTDADLIARYNYDEFVPAKFEPWLRFDHSPPLGGPAPDFPLWQLDPAGRPFRFASGIFEGASSGRETSLSAIWSHHTYTIVEFGSFT